MFVSIVLVLISITALTIYQVWNRGHFKRRGITTLRTEFLLGSFSAALRKKRATADLLRDLYNEARAKKLQFGGIFMGQLPILLVTDPQIIKSLAVSNFDSFTDRRPFVEKRVDSLLGRSLLSLRGDEWRSMRQTLSPAFTSCKLRTMMPLIEAACRELSRYLIAHSDVDIRETFRRFAADVIATTAFGSPSDAISDPKSVFYANGKGLLDFSGVIRTLVVGGYLIVPSVMRILRIPFIPPQITNFFISRIKGSVFVREDSRLSRPDMIQLLLDERRKGADISDTDIASQALTFFCGGFDTVSTAMTFAALELAANPGVQQRLREEVDAAFDRCEGKLDFETVKSLKYLDMVISEVLRIHPVVPASDRVCTRQVQLPQYGLYLRVGDVVYLPYDALHHDPAYFPDPERFDPERFSESNKHDIHPLTYLPFGTGPRNCIGIRFALLEIKFALAYTLAAVELRPGPDLQLPVRLDPKHLGSVPLGGCVLRVTARPQAIKRFASRH